MNDPAVAAHRHSSRHRLEVSFSEVCGCFYCLATFRPGDIEEWIDSVDGLGQTALCPFCTVDAVIGSASGYPISRAFLSKMYERWFAGCS